MDPPANKFAREIEDCARTGVLKVINTPANNMAALMFLRIDFIVFVSRVCV
jgi:hypothetical protein